MKRSWMIFGIIGCVHLAFAAEPTAKPNLQGNVETKPLGEVTANAEKLPTPPVAADEAPSTAPSPLAPGSRVVASKALDEDFVILGRLEPDLEDPTPIPSHLMPPTTSASTVPPVVVKAPVEVEAGIQPLLPHQEAVVVVAGPNIGETPQVEKSAHLNARIKPAVTVALQSPETETTALAPPPKAIALLQRPLKATQETEVTPLKALAVEVKKAPVLVKAKVHKVIPPLAKAKLSKPLPMQAKAVATKARVALKQNTVKHPIKTAALKTKRPIIKTAALKTKQPMIKTAVLKTAALKTKHVDVKRLAKQAPSPMKPQSASYHSPKKAMQALKASKAKPVKLAFKPKIKPFKPSMQHAERKSRAKSVMKPNLST